MPAQSHGMLRLHFVCLGNVYRSRLAVAYLRSRQLPGIEASSSGVQARYNHYGPIARWTRLTAERHGLVPYLEPEWTQTTPQLLARADKIVFMHRSVYELAVEMFGFDRSKCLIWDIADIGPVTEAKGEEVVRAAAEAGFAKIHQLVDELVEDY